MTTNQHCEIANNSHINKINKLTWRESDKINDKFKEFYLRDDYETYVAEYIGDVASSFQKIDYGAIEVTGPTFALISVKPGMLMRLLDEVPEIIYVENSYPFTLSQLERVEASTYTNFMGNTNSNLKGEGIIVGIISTGIDYLNKHFISNDGKTRIVSI
ncbi:hypothetical protein [Clostridium sp.]|uniref:hypothetical protein n=1 Tax=Clostridium sp. TaxID=1506 RepID=UPI002FC6A836